MNNEIAKMIEWFWKVSNTNLKELINGKHTHESKHFKGRLPQHFSNKIKTSFKSVGFGAYEFKGEEFKIYAVPSTDKKGAVCKWSVSIANTPKIEAFIEKEGFISDQQLDF